MKHTGIQRIQAYFGWCPNCPGAHVQARDPSAARVAPGIADRDPPQPHTLPVRIATPAWMNAIALVILFATIFVGGNPWWVAFVFVVLVIMIAIHIRSVRTRQGV